jgi:hypothetical protein
VGGLGLFLLGVIVMTDGLGILAGSSNRNVLQRFTRSRLSGVATGACSTVLLRSSTTEPYSSPRRDTPVISSCCGAGREVYDKLPQDHRGIGSNFRFRYVVFVPSVPAGGWKPASVQPQTGIA